MASKTIKISEQNYLWLLEIATEMQRKYEKPISFDEALFMMKDKKMKDKKLSDLAGKWKMSGKKAGRLKKSTCSCRSPRRICRKARRT